MFRAGRYGVDALLPDADGRLTPVSELLDAAVASARPHADGLECADQLELLPALLERGGGAGRQRAVHAVAGIDALLREMTRATAGSSLEEGSPEPHSPPARRRSPG